MALFPVTVVPEPGAVALTALRTRIDALIAAADIPTQFPDEVLAAAEAAAHVALPDDRVDMTDLAFVTLDPASSTDLDQAMLLAQHEGGFTVRYAIADVPRFVELDGVIDAEARRRGQTVYLPDRRIPLHPEVLSEGAASLLPGQDAPAFVWTMELDDAGALTSTTLDRAIVRSREKLAYDAEQEKLDAGDGHPQMQLLMTIGELRDRQERERGGASLNLPEQEVVPDGDSLRLTWRAPLPIEDANAQISLLTGMAAAKAMIDGGIGILRTMPPADEKAEQKLRRAAEALGRPWTADQAYGEFLASLDPRQPADLAILNQAASLFRGAGYTAFTSHDELPADQAELVQSAIGAPYAHTTAPLRRLVDRFVLLTCHALLNDRPVPPELVSVLPLIPPIMKETSAKGGALSRRALDLVEVMALASCVGRELAGTVLDTRDATTATDDAPAKPARAYVQFEEPPVTEWVETTAERGQRITVRVDAADPDTRETRLTRMDVADAPAAG